MVLESLSELSLVPTRRVSPPLTPSARRTSCGRCGAGCPGPGLHRAPPRLWVPHWSCRAAGCGQSIVAAIQRHPVVLVAGIGVGVVVDHQASHPAVAGHRLAGFAERHHRITRRIAAAEHQVGHLQVAPRQAQVRAPAEDDLAGGLRAQHDRGIRRALALQQQPGVGPGAVSQHDLIAGLQRRGGGSELRDIVDEPAGCTCCWSGQAHCQTSGQAKQP